MRVLIKFAISLLFLLCISFCSAATQSTAWYSHIDGKIELNVDLFLSSTCPHCQQADSFFRELEKTEPWLLVHRYVINEDKSALRRFSERLQQQNSTNFSVPTVFFCDSQWIGFANPESTGKTLLRGLNYCREQISSHGELTSTTIELLRQRGKANVLLFSTKTTSAAKIIIFSALVDALSACSLFSFMTFMAFLWLYPGRTQVQAGVGISYIVALAVVHYCGQAYPVFFYQISAWFRLPTVVAGLMLVFYIGHYLRQLKSPVNSRPARAVYWLVIFVAMMVYVYQQSCSVNLGLAFEQWLHEQPGTAVHHGLYAVSYQLIFLLPIALFLLGYLLVGQQKALLRYQHNLPIIACIILAVVGFLLIIYPPLLVHLMLSWLVLIMAMAGGWLFKKHDGR